MPSTVSPPINLPPTWRSELAASRAPVTLKIPAERPSASSVLRDDRGSERGKQIVTRGRGVVECAFVFPDLPVPSARHPPLPSSLIFCQREKPQMLFFHPANSYSSSFRVLVHFKGDVARRFKVSRSVSTAKSSCRRLLVPRARRPGCALSSQSCPPASKLGSRKFPPQSVECIKNSVAKQTQASAERFDLEPLQGGKLRPIMPSSRRLSP